MKIALPLDGTAVKRLRPMSKAVFKSEYAMEILLAIGESDRFYASQLPKLVPGCQQSFANDTVQRFASAGLITLLDKDDGQQRNYYRRVASPLWDLVRVWAESLLEAGEPFVSSGPQTGGELGQARRREAARPADLAPSSGITAAKILGLDPQHRA